jgi:hypothetical protein
MVYDNISGFINGLHTVHGFDDISDSLFTTIVTTDYGGIKLYIYHRVNGDKVFLFVEGDSQPYSAQARSQPNLRQLDEFFELLSPAHKEVFLWNIHLLK